MLARFFKFFLVSVTFILSGCHLFFAEEDTLTVLFTSDVRGKIESVRKPELYLGDLAVLHTIVLKEKSLSEHTVLLDAGDFTYDFLKKNYDIYDGFITALKVFKIYGVIGYDGVTPGDFDMKFGARFLKMQSERNNVPLVSANILAPDGSYWFKPFIIKDFEGRKVLITGLLNPSVKGVDFTVEDPYSSLMPVLEEARIENVDFVVVLSHLGYYNDQKFFPRISGVDLIVSAHDPDFIERPAPIGNAILVKSTLYGQHLGSITFRFTGSAPFEFVKEGKVKRENVHYKLINVKPTYAKKSPRVLETIRSMNTDWDKFRKFTEKCLPCHADKVSRWMEHPHSHNEIGCTYCHSVPEEHISSQVKFLNRKEVRKVCQKCHEFTEEKVKDILRKAGCGK